MDLETRRGVHTFTGLVPLGAYLAFHTWEHLPARLDRELTLERLRLSSSAPFEILFVFVPLLVHGALGLSLTRTEDHSLAYRGPAFRRLQALTGIVSAVFLLWHVLGVWLPRVRDDGGGRAALSAMLDQVGPVWGMGLYLLGLSAVCIHFGQGLSAVWIRRYADAPVRLARLTGAVIGLLIWLTLVDLLAVYAAGGALL